MNLFKHPLCIAHRGARHEAPENTWSAFEKALTHPIDGIELDVQMSADGVPFLFHDPTLWRVARQRTRAASFTIAELSRLDWGAWFDPLFSGEPLMTFEDLLQKSNRCPYWLIEIKARPRDRESGHAYRLTEKVITLINKKGTSSIDQRLMVLSFDPKVLALAHKLAPDLKYVLNLTGNESIASLEQSAIMPDQLWAVDIGIGRLGATLVQWAKSQELKVYTYTCNGPRQLKKAMDHQVDGIISDRPGWLTRKLKGA